MVSLKKDLYGQIEEQRTYDNTKSPIIQHTIEDLVLFFTFDISNSSLYKTINYADWPTVITKLFDEIRSTITSKVDKIKDVEFWRILGDEIVFLKRLKDLQDTWDSIECISDILSLMVCNIESGSFFSNWFPGDKNKTDAMHLHNIISLKAAAWIAVIHDRTNESTFINHPFGNIEIKFSGNNKNHWVKEILGNDIDTGFRLSKQVISRQLVVSFELSYLLYLHAKDNLLINRLHLITYKELKGIWDSKLYPIIWYNKEHTDFADSFYFDDYSNELVKKYLDRQNAQDNKDFPAEMYTINEIFFDKIIKARHLKKKLDHIIDKLQHGGEYKAKRFLDDYEKLELHCAVVCYDATGEKTKILIAKRSSKKDYLPSYWEFGCAKASSKHKLINRLEDEYKEDFGIKINLACSDERTDCQPIPLALYSVDKNNDSYNTGILLIAEIENPHQIILNKNKYEAYRWIVEDEVVGFAEESVPDFKNSLAKAYEFIKKMQMKN